VLAQQLHRQAYLRYSQRNKIATFMSFVACTGSDVVMLKQPAVQSQSSNGVMGACFPAGVVPANARNFTCQRTATTSSNSSWLQLVEAVFAGYSNNVHPYGVDPAFLRTSSLYKPDLQGLEGWYYNKSNPLEILPTTSTPFGFFHKTLQVIRNQSHAEPVWLDHRCNPSFV
jgi:hypothetical protein